MKMITKEVAGETYCFPEVFEGVFDAMDEVFIKEGFSEYAFYILKSWSDLFDPYKVGHGD